VSSEVVLGKNFHKVEFGIHGALAPSRHVLNSSLELLQKSASYKPDCACVGHQPFKHAIEVFSPTFCDRRASVQLSSAWKEFSQC